MTTRPERRAEEDRVVARGKSLLFVVAVFGQHIH